MHNRFRSFPIWAFVAICVPLARTPLAAQNTIHPALEPAAALSMHARFTIPGELLLPIVRTMRSTLLASTKLMPALQVKSPTIWRSHRGVW